MKIKSVGYLGIGAVDPLAWRHYGVDVLGMMPARANPGEGWAPPETAGNKVRVSGDGVAADGTVYLKMDVRQWRIAVHPDSRDRGMLYLGLELDGPLALEAAVKELQALQIPVELGTEEDAFARAVTGIARVKDPAGNALELFYGPATDYLFHSPTPGQQFVAGALGLGHLNLFVTQQAACFEFYTRVLGFRLTDYIRIGPGARLQFLRCNARHHSVAIMEMAGLSGLQHLMLEVRNIDDVGRLLDRATRAGVKITSTLGRHRNDGVLSFYMRSPSGFDVEIGCEGLLLDDSWTTNEFCEGDVWGHQGLLEAIQQSAIGMMEHAARAGGKP